MQDVSTEHQPSRLHSFVIAWLCAHMCYSQLSKASTVPLCLLLHVIGVFQHRHPLTASACYRCIVALWHAMQGKPRVEGDLPLQQVGMIDHG